MSATLHASGNETNFPGFCGVPRACRNRARRMHKCFLKCECLSIFRRKLSMTVHRRVSPIASLHDELFEQMFYWCQGNRSLSQPTEVDETLAPMEITVSHVSRQWRSISLSLSCLWNKILVSESSRAAHFPLDMAMAYLGRCRSSPLVARIELNTDPSPKFRHVLGLLLSKAQQWRRIALHFSVCEGASFFSELHGVSAPGLKYLSITSKPCVRHSPQDDSHRSLDVLFPLFAQSSACPNLELLRLSGRAISFRSPPLQAITTLHLEQCPMGRVLDWPRLQSLLAQCQRLVNLSIEGCILDRHSWLLPHPPNILMPFLRSLRIYGVTGEVYSGILLAMSAPNLECLFLKKAMGNDFHTFLDACAHAPPGFPRLNSIFLDGFEFHVQDYERWFHIFPDIKHITVLDTPIKVPTIIELLSGEINSKNSVLGPAFVPCPNLVSLTVLLHWEAPSFLLDAARYRYASGLPLVKIRLGVTSDVDEEDEEDLKVYLQEYVSHVEVFRETDPWPFNLPYIDEDDFWYCND